MYFFNIYNFQYIYKTSPSCPVSKVVVLVPKIRIYVSYDLGLSILKLCQKPYNGPFIFVHDETPQALRHAKFTFSNLITVGFAADFRPSNH